MEIDGVIEANKIMNQLIKKKKEGIGLGIIQIGEEKEKEAYVRMIKKKCRELDIYSRIRKYKGDVQEKEIIKEIEELNKDEGISGIIIQMPMPKHINMEKVCNTIDRRKDIEGVNQINVGKVCQGIEGYVPCTALACIKLIEKYDINVRGMEIVIIGSSNIVGKPLGMMLLNRGATVTLCHKDTKDIIKHTREADMIIACCGVQKLVKRDWIMGGVIIIDVGINESGGEIVGDVDYENIKDRCKYITPVPGGVGPMTVMMLMYQLMNKIDE